MKHTKNLVYNKFYISNNQQHYLIDGKIHEWGQIFNFQARYKAESNIYFTFGKNQKVIWLNWFEIDDYENVYFIYATIKHNGKTEHLYDSLK